MPIRQDKAAEFSSLFKEFAASYPQTTAGQRHVVFYRGAREQARKNLESIVAMSEQGQDITEAVLFKLLPYADTEPNRAKGMWVSIAPAFSADVRGKFEPAGWTKPDDWPKIAQAILRFVRRCNENPQQLAKACAEFAALPYSKGFQTGTLTPILNALRPDDYVLINNKSRQVPNYLAGTNYAQRLTDYPQANATAQTLIKELSGEMRKHTDLDILDVDLFDMFCHWLVAVKKYDFGSVAYWKIAPGEKAWNWEGASEVVLMY